MSFLSKRTPEDTQDSLSINRLQQRFHIRFSKRSGFSTPLLKCSGSVPLPRKVYFILFYFFKSQRLSLGCVCPCPGFQQAPGLILRPPRFSISWHHSDTTAPYTSNRSQVSAHTSKSPSAGCLMSLYRRGKCCVPT